MGDGKNNYTYCWTCRDWKEVLGHSEINCPNVVCLKCGVKGHIKPDCPITNIGTQSNLIRSGENSRVSQNSVKPVQMENVPIKVDSNYGKNWYEAH